MKRWELSILLAGAQTCPQVSLLSAEAGGLGKEKEIGAPRDKPNYGLFYGSMKGSLCTALGRSLLLFSPVHLVLRQYWNGAFICPFSQRKHNSGFTLVFLVKSLSLRVYKAKELTFRLHFYEFCSLLSGYPNICVLTSNNRMHCIVWWYPDSSTEHGECSVLVDQQVKKQPNKKKPAYNHLYLRHLPMLYTL